MIKYFILIKVIANEWLELLFFC